MKYMTRSIAGTISHLYCLVLEYNEGNPTGAKAEINALPSHLGANNKNASENHQFCPFRKHSWCDYQRALFDESPTPNHSYYLSMKLIAHVNRIFSKYRYNEEEFIHTLSFGLTTNNNESMYGILRDMVPKKAKPALDAILTGSCVGHHPVQRWI